MQIGIWAALMVVMLITEAATQSLVSIWFAIGALAALLAAVFGCTLPVQTAIFFFVSGILMAFLLPVARKKLAQVKTATNADRILEKTAVVTEKINPSRGTGQIRVMGNIWSAKSADDTEIEEGTEVVVTEIAGVKAVVRPKVQ